MKPGSVMASMPRADSAMTVCEALSGFSAPIEAMPPSSYCIDDSFARAPATALSTPSSFLWGARAESTMAVMSVSEYSPATAHPPSASLRESRRETLSSLLLASDLYPLFIRWTDEMSGDMAFPAATQPSSASGMRLSVPPASATAMAVLARSAPAGGAVTDAAAPRRYVSNMSAGIPYLQSEIAIQSMHGTLPYSAFSSPAAFSAPYLSQSADTASLIRSSEKLSAEKAAVTLSPPAQAARSGAAAGRSTVKSMTADKRLIMLRFILR